MPIDGVHVIATQYSNEELFIIKYLINIIL